jgi:2-amino-4-hydroxy-6-hydroxymethyldihydropteridine diphosphokinase
MVTAYIALGSNLGDPAQSVHLARLAMGGIPEVKLVVASSLYKSKPIDASGADYVNAVVKIETNLNAYELLAELHKLEGLAGRTSPKDRAHLHNAPRTLDLDILLYGEACIDSASLTIPHPRMRSRAFVLLPLAEIAPTLVSAADLRTVQNQTIHKLAS